MKDYLKIKAAIKKANDSEFLAVASSDVIDRQGESINQGGWELSNFKKNPILLAFHDATKPIGRATKVWISKTGEKPTLKIKGVISEATAISREIKQLMSEGILSTLSVGFRPVDMDDNTYTKQELLEVSVVSIPANPEAQVLAYKSLSKSGFNDDDIEAVGVPVHFIKSMDNLEKRIALVEAKANTAVKGLQYLNPHGRKEAVIESRLALNKVIARANDKLLSKNNLPKDTRATLLKVVKRANERLINDQKQELKLNGKN